jgi:exonuclease VII small subunit
MAATTPTPAPMTAPTPPPTQLNPAAQLADAVSRLYDLAGNSQVPADQRKALLLQAHDLRGDLVSLVSMQFTQNTAAYQSVMANLNSVVSALNQAQQDIQQAVGVVAGAGQLAKSIDDLLQQAVQLGATVA